MCNGLRRSTLIQFSPSKRLIVHGRTRRRQSCIATSRSSSLTDSDPSYYCYEKLYSFKEGRKLGKGRYACWSYQDKKKQELLCNEIDVDQVDIILDLLTEEVGFQNIGVKHRTRIPNKDPSNVTCKTETVHSGSAKWDLKHDNKAAEIRSSEEVCMRLSSEKRSLVNCQGKKEGSSCSSYYSVSSTGENDSDNDVEMKHEDFYVRGESSKDDGEMKLYSRIYDEEDGKEESEELKKTNTAETYYGNQEWRKKSEKKLNVDSSQQQSQISLNIERNSQQQHDKKAERVAAQSQSRMKYKRHTEMSDSDSRRVIESSSSTQKRYSDTENKFIPSVQELASEHKGESCDSIAKKDKYRKQSNVILEASGIHETDKRVASSSYSSSVETRMKNWEDHSTQVSDRFEDQIEEKHQRFTQDHNEKFGLHETDKRVASSSSSSSLETKMKNSEDHLTQVSDLFEDQREEKHQRFTTSKESRVKSQQISEILDTHIINARRQSDIRNEKQQLQLETSSSSGEKVTMVQQSSLSSGVKMVEETTKESGKTGRKTTKASSFHVGMPSSSSSYKALKLIPEPNSSSSLPIAISSSSAGGEDAIASADHQQKSSGHFVGDFVEKAKHELSISEEAEQEKKPPHEVESVYEDGEQHEVKSSGEVGVKKGPSDEIWHQTDDTSSGDIGVKSGRSLWNVIGDMVRLRWARSETHTPKSGSGSGSGSGLGGGKAVSSNPSISSEGWFSGHEPDDSNDVKIASTKVPSSSKEKLELPLLLSSSSNTNANQKGSSSSKTMSPSVIEEESSMPAIQMRRSPAAVVKTTSGETYASSSTIEQIPLTQVAKPDDGGDNESGKVDRQPVGRKLARIDQVSQDRFDEWEEAYTIEAKQRKDDEFFMREALLEAKKAADLWEVPVGAVLVQDGKVIGRGYNLVEELRDSTAHAEMVCIREASNNLRSWRLSGTTLYVTLEPCPMCAGAILQARIDTLVWGAPNKLLGADGSWIRLFPDGDGGGGDKPPAPVHPFHPNMTVRRGVLSAECADAMQQFFQLRRKKQKKTQEPPPSPPPPPPSCLPITNRHHSKFFTKLHDTFSVMFCL